MNDFSENWQQLRLRAGDRADLLGNAWPTKKQEAYHYASLSSLDKTKWKKAPSLSEKDLKEKITALSLPEVNNRLVFSNGYFMPSLSFLGDGGNWQIKKNVLEEGCEKLSFEERLNLSLGEEKISLKIPFLKASQSLQILFLNEGENISLHSAVDFEVSENQKISVFEVHAGEGHFLENNLIHVKSSKSSHISWVKAQFSGSKTASLSHTYFDLAEGAKASWTLLAKGNLFEREVFRAVLADENAVLEANGLQLVGKDQLADFNISVAHEANHTFSQQSFKALAIENGHAIFQGKSAISKRGNKSEAHQKSDALLLSDRAIFDVKPELEIFADDVKCTHGATVGALEEQDIFYLRARGIALDEAKRLLLFSFVKDILDHISDENIHLWVQDYVFPFLDFEKEEIFHIEQEGKH
ncbi:SufD family Fe-S cluster assembly protein [Acetobacteraceae bacterium]|nr:SufD family Fe-S cluster assembly protein [Acetobacteraceae bacterium]